LYVLTNSGLVQVSHQDKDGFVTDSTVVYLSTELHSEFPQAVFTSVFIAISSGHLDHSNFRELQGELVALPIVVTLYLFSYLRPHFLVLKVQVMPSQLT
jgi:hypothetical protein